MDEICLHAIRQCQWIPLVLRLFWKHMILMSTSMRLEELQAILNGNFALMWEPPVPGQYMVIASFLGSESYWGSYA